MHDGLQRELQDFILHKAPGLSVSFQENPAFNSVTLGLSLKVDHKQLISEQAIAQSQGRAVGDKLMEMLAEVQKAVVTAIGLEEYVRERELAVLDRLSGKIEENLGTISKDGIDPIRQAREELGG